MSEPVFTEREKDLLYEAPCSYQPLRDGPSGGNTYTEDEIVAVIDKLHVAEREAELQRFKNEAAS